jgi:DNA modification methylase
MRSDMTIIWKRTDELLLHPANERKHPEKNLEALKGSLTAFGFQKPVVVNADGLVLAGNGTLMAARALGLERVPCVVSDLEELRQAGFRIADNRTGELAEWDLDALGATTTELEKLGVDLESLGFDSDFLDSLNPERVEGTEGLTDPDDVPESVETRCKSGDLWVLGKHRLLCGDSTSADDVARLFGGERAELCFTSPPYADQREYNGGKELSTEHLATFIRAAYSFVSFFAVNLGLSRKDGEMSQYWDDYIKEAKGCGLNFLSWNVWDKGECGSIGNQTAMFGISHEWILVFGAKRKPLNLTVPNKSAGARANHTGNRQADGSIKKSKERTVAEFSQLKTVYSLPAQKARDDIDHPARFPVELPQGYIEACTAPNQGVYESFSGSGSTFIACEKTGRRCFGMELDPKYCDVILSRWERFTGQTAQLLSE